ncbi:MAG: peptidylprolyl isomerase [Salinivirgaceae bacterium]|nr:peptidylprolyl isomerase [Salinivirgaceae bacterium]
MRLSILTLALASAMSAMAQPDDNQTILTIDNKTISCYEFKRLYMKNNTEAAFDSASLAEYMQLFIDYKLKVFEGEALGMDTTPSFAREFGDYIVELEKPYLTDASVDDSLAREAYEHMHWDIRASHILIRCTENASAADTLKAYKRAQNIHKRALKEDFNKLARETSEDPSAAQNGGDLGYFTAFSMIYDFERMAYATKVGAVSPIFRTRYGYHILKVFDRRPNPGEIRASQIMIVIPQNADDAAVKAAHDKAQLIADSLNAGADWTKMVLRHSEDRSTNQKDGDLGWFGTGVMVADYENAAFGLKNIGDISAPVRTPNGWHIIKLTGRKPIDSFENLQEDLKKKLSNDARSQMAHKAVIERFKREYKFVEDKAALIEFINCVDSTAWDGKWSIDKAKGLNKNIFTIDDTIQFSQQRFAGLVYSNQIAVRKRIPIDVQLRKDYARIVEYIITAYARKELPKKYPELKYLKTEYHDGILIFALMDKMVWNKASTDSAGLASFYEANKERYMWGDRAEVAICSYKGDAITGSIVKIVVAKLEAALKAGVKKGNYTEQSKAALQKLGINPDSVDMQVTVKNYNIVDGKDAGLEGDAANAKYCDIDGTKIDMNAWDRNKFKIHYGKRTEVLYLVKQVPPMPKTLDECRGTAIADYQDALEKEWVAQLRAKHTVKINEKVFNSLIKNK